MFCQIKGPLQLSCYKWPSFGTASTTMDEIAFFSNGQYLVYDGWRGTWANVLLNYVGLYLMLYRISFSISIR